MVPRLLVALLLVTAGCTAADVGGDAAPTPTETANPSGTVTATPTGTTSTTTPNESDTVAYDDLTATQRHAFVRKNSTRDSVSYRESAGDAFATYGVRATAASAPADATVVSLENVSTGIRDEVRWGVENGSRAVPAGQ